MFVMFATVIAFDVPIIDPESVVTVTGVPPISSEIVNVVESIICKI